MQRAQSLWRTSTISPLLQVIDLGDDMEFSLLPAGASKDLLECSDPTIPSDDSNLVIKALNLYRRKTGSGSFFKVKLNKKVPHGECWGCAPLRCTCQEGAAWWVARAARSS
jgi:hypothetical protein